MTPLRRVTFHRLASQEYRTARQRYENHRAGLGNDFAQEVDRTVQRIAANPEVGTLFRKRFRWMKLRRFPYLLYYLPLDSDHILVVAVAHGQRRLGYWLWRARRQ